jgi:amphiphysin
MTLPHRINPASQARADIVIIIAMTASQMRIAETIDTFYGDSGAKDGVSRSYKQAVEDLDTETIKALDGPYRWASLLCAAGPLWQNGKCAPMLITMLYNRTTVLDPIMRFCAYFPDVNECTHLLISPRTYPL